ncbi:MAG: HAD family hydrolase [Candidatus Hydrogenedentota bacterium]
MAKILFDFDGVLTEQSEEADRVLEIFCERLSERAGLSSDTAAGVVAEAERALKGAPWNYGWMSHGRVSAFANEDLFIRNNGIAAWLDSAAESGHPMLASARTRLEGGGHGSFTNLCRESYDTMAGETRAGARHPVDPDAGPLLRSLLDAGHYLVVVSNSGTSRILALLQEVGVPALEHAGDGSGAMRIRGGARKYDLDETSSCFEAGPYRIETIRPVYEKILREERPDLVIGDVVTLDLALPIRLAREKVIPSARVLLRVRDYTPEWSRSFIEREVEGARAITKLEEILSLLP